MNITQTGSTFHLLPIILSLTTVYHVWITERTYFSISSHHFVCKTVHHVRITEGTYLSFSPYHVVSYSWYKFDLLFTFSNSYVFHTKQRGLTFHFVSIILSVNAIYYAHVTQRTYYLLSLCHLFSDLYMLGTYYTEDLLFTFSQPLGDQVWGGHGEKGGVVGFSGHSFGQVRLPCTRGL